jgi:uncharacterized membrane protein
MVTNAETRPTSWFERNLPWLWAGSTAILLAFLAAFPILSARDHAGAVWAQAFTLATLPGKYVIFSGLVPGAPIAPWGLAVLAVLVDFVIATSLAMFLGLLARWPFAARRLKAVHERTEAVLTEYPRLRRMAFLGTVLFVYLPLPASGSIGGTFLGQLVGLSRGSTVAAVTLGGALVSATFAWLATTIGAKAEAMAQNPWVVAGAVVGFAGFVWVGWWRLKRALRS